MKTMYVLQAAVAQKIGHSSVCDFTQEAKHFQLISCRRFDVLLYKLHEMIIQKIHSLTQNCAIDKGCFNIGGKEVGRKNFPNFFSKRL